MTEMMELGVKDFITVTLSMHSLFKDLKENASIMKKEMKDKKRAKWNFKHWKIKYLKGKIHWLGIKIIDSAEKLSVKLKHREKKDWKKEK